MSRAQIKRVFLCHSTRKDGKMLHLVKMKDGRTLTKTTKQARAMGIIKMRGERSYM